MIAKYYYGSGPYLEHCILLAVEFLHYGLLRWTFPDLRFHQQKMANPYTAGNYRNRGIFSAESVQACAAAGNKHIHISVHFHKLVNKVSVRVIDELNNSRIQTCGFRE